MTDQELLITASALRAIGEILIGSIVLSLHLHLIKQAILEGGVLEWLIRKRKLTVLGIILIVAGFGIELLVRINL